MFYWIVCDIYYCYDALTDAQSSRCQTYLLKPIVPRVHKRQEYATAYTYR